MGVFKNIVLPQNGWFIMEIPIKMDDLGVPLVLETPIFGYIWVLSSIGFTGLRLHSTLVYSMNFQKQ